MKHILSSLVLNKPGVLANVAGMFAARGFNIDSLVVGRTENPELSRMTIVVIGDVTVLEQVRKQLQKLVPVVKVVDYQDVAFVERDLVIVQVNTRDGDNPVSSSIRVKCAARGLYERTSSAVTTTSKATPNRSAVPANRSRSMLLNTPSR